MTKLFPDPSILLHPQIPKPLHLLNPRTIFGEDWWNKARQIAYYKHNYRCYACGIKKENAKLHQWLEAHEMYDINYKTGEVKFIEIVALCHYCHNYIHRGRLERLLQKHKITLNFYIDIINHGEKILKKAKLEHKLIPTNTCKWKQWHLVIDGKNYGQKFKSEKEWQEYWRNHN